MSTLKFYPLSFTPFLSVGGSERIPHWCLIGGFILAGLAGCSHAPPIQEMSDARQIAQTAVDAGAITYLPLAYRRVQTLLTEAEDKLAIKDYEGAGQRARAAKTKAIEIRTLTQKLLETQDRIAEATEMGCPQAETAELLTQALGAAANGDVELASVWVDQTHRQILLAIGQCSPQLSIRRRGVP